MRPSTLLRGLVALVIGVAAVSGGLAMGAGLGAFSGDTESATSQPTNDVRAEVVAAILHPASSPSSKRRRRARLSVHVRMTNRSARRVVLSRPVLMSGAARLETDLKQDSAATHLRALAAGATGDVTLRFEIVGAVTTRVRQELRVRLVIAGRNVPATVKVGGPVSG